MSSERRTHSFCRRLIFDPCLLIGFPNSFFDRHFYSSVATDSRAYYDIKNAENLHNFYTDLFWIYQNGESDDIQDLLTIQRKLQDIWVTLGYSVFNPHPCSEKHAEETRLLQMVEYLRKNYAYKFSLTDMADTLHISRGECCRFFKKMMGMTISDYLLDYRLGKSTELLNSTNVNITEIAHTVGFNSVSNFSALFKSKTGYTPRDFRNHVKSN